MQHPVARDLHGPPDRSARRSGLRCLVHAPQQHCVVPCRLMGDGGHDLVDWDEPDYWRAILGPPAWDFGCDEKRSLSVICRRRRCLPYPLLGLRSFCLCCRGNDASLCL